jgi:hypothetical protein
LRARRVLLFKMEDAMREPDRSNAAQQNQDRKGSAPGAAIDESGAVHGGEAAKPGQMEGDADVDSNAPPPGADALNKPVGLPRG